MEKHFGTRTSSNQDFVQIHFVAFLSFVLIHLHEE